MSGKALTLSSEKVSSPMQLLGIKSPKEQKPDIRPRVYTADFDVVALTPNSEGSSHQILPADGSVGSMASAMF